MSFASEALLFQKALDSPFINNFVQTAIYPSIGYVELKGFFGIPDLVIANLSITNIENEVIRTFAFEMKLSNWKRALMQAYRYRAFVNFSFVVLDRDFSKPAITHLDQFELSNVGLMSIDDNGYMSVHHFPHFNDPYSIPLTNKFNKMVQSQDIDTTQKSWGVESLINNREISYHSIPVN